MKLKFYGATQQVTGSMHLLEFDNNSKILIDCGLQYESGDKLDINDKFPFNPSEINCIILTHSHIDHSGNIPTIVKHGFKGTIYCTKPTASLVENLLYDSVNVQYAVNKSKKKGKKSKQNTVLYSSKHVKESLEHIKLIDFHNKIKINENFSFTFYNAGHILGAASVLAEINENGKTIKIGFTGDLGKENSKIVVNPEIMPDIDYLVCESTYGNRKHKCLNTAEDEILNHINLSCKNKKGRLIIAAFSVGRTQAILFTLNQLYKRGELNGIKVFTDSKLGIQSTRVHEQFDEYMNNEAQEFFKKHGDLFNFPNLKVIETEYDQQDLNYQNEPYIIVSSAGMVEGGRIQQHVRNNIHNPVSYILIAGYCADGTLGNKLLQGQKSIKIGSFESPVYAKVTSTDIFSAHPDRDGLVKYLKDSENKNLKKVFLIHGDKKTIEGFKEYLEEINFNKIEIPIRGNEYTF
ncbi:MAG: MBL fold metallo-hydrolase [Bacteroidetes bacterium]|nr:MBL fold metallo-hydrolase [Bacteroidota bacterium]